MTNNPTAGGSSGDDRLDSAKREALEEFTGKCNALVSRIHAVSEQVEVELATVSGRTEYLIERDRRMRRGMRVLYMVAGFLAAAAIALTVIAVHVAGAQDELQRSDRTQNEQALCPLYTVFINADTPQARDAAGRAGQDLGARDHAFNTIRESYTVLGCSPELTPEGRIPR